MDDLQYEHFKDLKSIIYPESEKNEKEKLNEENEER